MRFCLECHRSLAEEDGLPDARSAIHLGEVIVRENPGEHVALGAKPLELEGAARQVVARLLSLSRARQTLLTRVVFELARRAMVGEAGGFDPPPRWLAHGDYRFDAPDEIVEVFEVGQPGVAPLGAPRPHDEPRTAPSTSRPLQLGSDTRHGRARSRIALTRSVP